MLSTFPTVIPYDSLLGNPFPVLSPAASPPWECHDLLPGFHLPVSPGFDDFPSFKPVISCSGSDDPDPNRNQTDPKTCYDEPKRKSPVIDERKRRRMESNRESARRSRMRKQKHLENQRNLANQLRNENRDLSNRLRFTQYHINRVRTENDRLQSEHTILRQKLLYIRQVLILREQNLPSI